MSIPCTNLTIDIFCEPINLNVTPSDSRKRQRKLLSLPQLQGHQEHTNPVRSHRACCTHVASAKSPRQTTEIGALTTHPSNQTTNPGGAERSRQPLRDHLSAPSKSASQEGGREEANKHSTPTPPPAAVGGTCCPATPVSTLSYKEETCPPSPSFLLSLSSNVRQGTRGCPARGGRVERCCRSTPPRGQGGLTLGVVLP